MIGVIILLLVLGVLTGIVAGFFGVGGGLLFSPILFILFSVMDVSSPVSLTIGTSLFCTFIASLSSSIQQRKDRNIYWKEGLFIGLFGSMSVYAGKQFVTSSYYTEEIFVFFFVVLLFFVSILFYRRSRSHVTLQLKGKEMGLMKLINAGGLGGLVASLAGVGGGIVLVPIMNLWYRLPIAKAVSVSSLAIVIISLSGWLQFALFVEAVPSLTGYSVGYVDFGASLPLVAGGFAGGIIGVRLNKHAKGKNVQLGFSILVIFIAISMILNIM